MTHKVPARKIAVGLAAIAVAASTSVLARAPEPAQADPAGTIAMSEEPDPVPTWWCLLFPEDCEEEPTTPDPTTPDPTTPDPTTPDPTTPDPTTPDPTTPDPTTPDPTTPEPSTSGSVSTPKPSTEPPEETTKPPEETTPPPEETTPPRTTPPEAPPDEAPPPPRTQQPRPNPAVPGPPQDPQPPEVAEDDSEWDFRRTLPPDRDFSDPVPTRPFAGSEQPDADEDQTESAEPEAQADTAISPPSLAQAWMWSAFGVAGVLLAGAGWMNYRGRIGKP